MRNFLLGSLFALASFAQATVNPPYTGTTISTTTGKATQYVSGFVKLATSSSTADTTNVTLDGTGNGTFLSSVTAGAFFGDGSHITGLPGEANTYTSSKTFTSNVLVSGNLKANRLQVPTLDGFNSDGSATFSNNLASINSQGQLAAISLTSTYGVNATTMNATSSMTASAFFGDGSHLTGVPSTGSISGSFLSLSSFNSYSSTITSALGTKLSSGAVPAPFVDLSTVTAALALKLDLTTYNTYSSTITSALNTKLSSGAVPASFIDLSTVTTALATKASTGTDNSLVRANALSTIGGAVTFLSSVTFNNELLIASPAQLKASSATLTYGISAASGSFTGNVTAASGTFTNSVNVTNAITASSITLSNVATGISWTGLTSTEAFITNSTGVFVGDTVGLTFSSITLNKGTQNNTAALYVVGASSNGALIQVIADKAAATIRVKDTIGVPTFETVYGSGTVDGSPPVSIDTPTVPTTVGQLLFRARRRNNESNTLAIASVLGRIEPGFAPDSNNIFSSRIELGAVTGAGGLNTKWFGISTGTWVINGNNGNAATYAYDGASMLDVNGQAIFGTWGTVNRSTIDASGFLTINGSTLTVASTGILTAPSQPFTRSTTTAAQNIPNNANQDVYFGSDLRDDQNMHDTVSSSATFTVPTGGAGKYRGNCSLTWAASATGVRGVGWLKNGVVQLEYTQAASGSVVTVSQQVTFEDFFVAGDAVKCYAFQTSGAPMNITNAAMTFSKGW